MSEVRTNIKTVAGIINVSPDLLNRNPIDVDRIMYHALFCQGCADCTAAEQRRKEREEAERREAARLINRAKAWLAERLVSTAEWLGWEPEECDC